MLAQEQQQSIYAATIAHFILHALNTCYCKGALGTWVSPDNLQIHMDRRIWFEYACVDGEIFESGKKNYWFNNIGIRVDRALGYEDLNHVLITFILLCYFYLMVLLYDVSHAC